MARPSDHSNPTSPWKLNAKYGNIKLRRQTPRRVMSVKSVRLRCARFDFKLIINSSFIVDILPKERANEISNILTH